MFDISWLGKHNHQKQANKQTKTPHPKHKSLWAEISLLGFNLKVVGFWKD